jgi:hypothetical protein
MKSFWLESSFWQSGRLSTKGALKSFNKTLKKVWQRPSVVRFEDYPRLTSCYVLKDVF